MSKHPQQHTDIGGVHTGQPAAAPPPVTRPASLPGRPAPLSVSDLYASGQRDVTVNPLLGEQVGGLAGITSGQGNQGSAGGWFAGQAGTYGDARGMPRNLKQGTSLTGFV